MKNTVVVNLFGGPCTGKSTCAAYVFSLLKMSGLDVELVTEFAKDVTWEGNEAALANQYYILGNQCFRLSRLLGKVDIIITDSPLPLNTLYLPNTGENVNFRQAVFDIFDTYKNINYVLKPSMNIINYKPTGRNQTKEEAMNIQAQCIQLLDSKHYKYKSIDANKNDYQKIVDEVLSFLENIKESKIQ